MRPFLVGHATHPDWRVALPLALAQVDARLAERAHAGARPDGDLTLGFVYFTDHYADEAALLVDELRRRWPAVSWTGTVGLGVAATGVEYFDEPALVLMMAALPEGRFRVFSGKRPLAAFDAHTALVHADPTSPDLAELVGEMSDRTASGYLFGGLGASRHATPQVAGTVVHGGLSGVAFSAEVAILSRVTQGCQPVGPTRRITSCERNVALTLDGLPALDCLRDDLGIDLAKPQQAIGRLRSTLAGLTDPQDALPPGQAPRLPRDFGPSVRVRHLAGIDMAHRGVAVGDRVEVGMTVAFCERHADAARRDLVRICAEIREELDPAPHDDDVLAGHDLPAPDAAEPGGRQILGALYVSCVARGGSHFGGPSAELQLIARALGDVPLVGFFAGGEIGHRHLYGYTGVLTVFCTGQAPA